MNWDKTVAFVHAVDELAESLLDLEECPWCNGHGSIMVWPGDEYDYHMTSQCRSCNGSGKINFAADGYVVADTVMRHSGKWHADEPPPLDPRVHPNRLKNFGFIKSKPRKRRASNG